SALSLRQKEDSESEFAENDRINDDFPLIVAQPPDHDSIGRRFCRFAEYVGINKVLHNVSVDSDSTGTKNPFSGHASSHWTTPSFGGTERRTSRYSPRSSLSISNSCPDSMLSCCRSSAGNTICPFDETVVFTIVR